MARPDVCLRERDRISWQEHLLLMTCENWAVVGLLWLLQTKLLIKSLVLWFCLLLRSGCFRAAFVKCMTAGSARCQHSKPVPDQFIHITGTETAQIYNRRIEENKQSYF